MENDKLKRAIPCSLEVAKQLSSSRIYPCTYYSYVEVGEGDFATYQILKTREAINLGFAHPALTDYEAKAYLDSIETKTNYVKYYEKTLIITSEKFSHKVRLPKSFSRPDHLAYSIIYMISVGLIKDFMVCNFFEEMKIRRYLSNE